VTIRRIASPFFACSIDNYSKGLCLIRSLASRFGAILNAPVTIGPPHLWRAWNLETISRRPCPFRSIARPRAVLVRVHPRFFCPCESVFIRGSFVRVSPCSSVVLLPVWVRVHPWFFYPRGSVFIRGSFVRVSPCSSVVLCPCESVFIRGSFVRVSPCSSAVLLSV
jgi:hypothetical protein